MIERFVHVCVCVKSSKLIFVSRLTHINHLHAPQGLALNCADWRRTRHYDLPSAVLGFAPEVGINTEK